MVQQAPSRRTFLTMAAAAPLAAGALTACGGSSGPGQSGDGSASIWILTGAPGEGIRTDSVETFNESSESGQLELTAFQNDAYKTKIRTAIGANQAPTIIWTWGGGGLRDYVKNDQVEDLTSWFDENADYRDSLFSSAFAAATVDDAIYAVPCENVSPIVLFYNTRLFDQVGAKPPATWDELMALVPVFNDAGIAPFSLGGQSRWTNMMWLEFLFDRIGGPELWRSIYEGEAEAWSAPDSIDALTKMQELVEADGFITGFESITADSNADRALLYTDKAAMMLHGAWVYGGIKEEGGDFVSGGNLGYMNFPAVDGGKGDPANSVGNPSSYYALNANATDEAKEIAQRYFLEGLNSAAQTQAWIDTGAVPIVNGSDTGFAGSDDADWLQFVYDIASSAPNFEQSWDQALSPSAAETLLNNIEQLFGLSITPQQFADNMNAVLGQ
ncbi:extracellular solute-binding protein [Pseudactinotalea sp.]|uniref:extracellular solute-binding protein n=1 Tax=Pseudactinotalea sp. TaxID=1926260 RepID=UPI003B3BDC23